ncbi:MAG: mechanosensitive ion channel domain-containing protein [Thermoguttaceae bacterium]|jgi:small-conductance mechanosensitive channel
MLLSTISHAELAAAWQEVIPPNPVETFLNHLLLYLPRVTAAIAVFLVFWFLGKCLERLVRRLTCGRNLESSIANLLANSTAITLLVLGSISALGTLGINISALVAGLGLTSLALGLALKEIVANVLSGIMVIVYKPFREGDVISVASAATSFEGTVREINLRFTMLAAEGKRIYVPNSLVLGNAVVVREDVNT